MSMRLLSSRNRSQRRPWSNSKSFETLVNSSNIYLCNREENLEKIIKKQKEATTKFNIEVFREH